MTRIVFYRHERADRGLRTGLEVDGVGLFESFREGEVERDPALIWYIDLQFVGSTLPDESEAVRQWLMTHSESICRLLRDLSQQISAGFDPELRPFQREFENWSSDVKFTVTASAVDRVTARSIGQELVEIAEGWSDILAKLEPLVSV